jgi:type IV pilus assembly protein PilE
MKVRYCLSAIRQSSGFSLIELMIALAIGAILIAIAVPMYTKQVQHSRRVDARTAVLDIAGREERYMSVQSSYTNVPANLGYAAAGPATFPMTVGSGYYQANVTVVAAAAPLPPTYKVFATPVAGSSQLKDTQCQYFSVDSTGKQFSSASIGGGGADTSAVCWQ